MIRNDKDLIKEVKRYFGRDRRLLKQTVKNLDPSDTDLKQWKTFFEKYFPKKFDVNERLFKEFADLLFSKKYDKIDWDFIGDLSWDVEIVLNNEVTSHLDFDIKLAAKCKNNTARFLNIYISDIIPAFTICPYYMYYKDDIYEFGPLKLIKREKKLIYKLKSDLRKTGFYFVKKEIALRKFKELKSDLNSDGNASIFDCLFNDLNNYTDEYVRYSVNDIFDPYGRKTGWREYYDKRKKFIKREDNRWFKSGDLEQVVSNVNGQIVEVNIYPKKDRPQSIELNIEKTKLKYKNKFAVYLP
jgi:hypothetical protein